MKRQDPLDMDMDMDMDTSENASNDNDNTSNAHSEEEKLDKKEHSFKVNQYWNNKNEKLVSDLGEKSSAYQWLHNKAARRLYNTDKIIGVGITILAGIISIESQLPKDDNFIIATNILKFLTFVTSSINIFLNYQEASEKHKQAGVKFQNLYNIIEEEVSQYKQQRHNAMEFIRDSNKMYTSIISESPNISDRELKAFKNIFKNNSTTKPNILDSLNHIVPIKSKGAKLSNLHEMTQNLCDVVNITDDITDDDILNIKSERLRFQTERFMNQI
jgi:hypothetical protein